ncbi:hypothetical protein Cgig2_000658 [Carnegiea gigantea]|uniref:Zinc finger PMZ-type domain-containing protein n=1 Tax=Carnegiea gigantea TaxID=171969 RepID=A0A9Q1GIQ1_9CARY|nr:hypothetical protein Cgig2_000658 [Carnegiea gigantea]
MSGRVVRGRSVGKVMLPGGRKDSAWVKKNMGVLKVLRSVEEAMGELLPLGRDGDVKKLMKGNDEYAYLYVAGSEGPCKLGLKVDKRKTELEKWKNGVGDRIEKKLRKPLANIGFVADVKLFDTTPGEYERKCSCKWRQLKGLPYAHAMAVIHNQKLWVYDYVSDWYKAGSRSTVYMNNIHPMETYDSAIVDNATGVVVGGEALDDGYNRRILLPLKPCSQGRP